MSSNGQGSTGGPSKGALLFYVPGAPAYTMDGIFERLIQLRTGGPYCHVEVDLGDGTSVGALSQGVERHPRPNPQAWAAAGSLCDPSKLEKGLRWVLARVGEPYGWGDVVDAAFGAPVSLGLEIPGTTPRYDCSHLACRFLAIAGYPLPQNLRDAPPSVSPNDLARMLGLAKK